MAHKFRISSPTIFEPLLAQCKTFNHCDWLFDGNPGVVAGFRPDIMISFEANARPAGGIFGHSALINRQIVAHNNLGLGDKISTLQALEAQTYVTMTHGDDVFLTVTKEGATIKPSKVFRANDVLAAELAVKLKIGYSALPHFLIESHIHETQNLIILQPGWQVSPTYLRIQSGGPSDIGLSEIHETLLNFLTPVLKVSWAAFGQNQNVVSMVNSK